MNGSEHEVCVDACVIVSGLDLINGVIRWEKVGEGGRRRVCVCVGRGSGLRVIVPGLDLINGVIRWEVGEGWRWMSARMGVSMKCVLMRVSLCQGLTSLME